MKNIHFVRWRETKNGTELLNISEEKCWASEMRNSLELTNWNVIIIGGKEIEVKKRASNKWLRHIFFFTAMLLIFEYEYLTNASRKFIREFFLLEHLGICVQIYSLIVFFVRKRSLTITIASEADWWVMLSHRNCYSNKNLLDTKSELAEEKRKIKNNGCFTSITCLQRLSFEMNLHLWPFVLCVRSSKFTSIELFTHWPFW